MNKKYTREELTKLSALYYRSEKYELMIEAAKQMIAENPELTETEQNIFYEGYKFKINKQRKSLIKLIEIERKERKRRSTHIDYISEIKEPAIKALIETADDFDTQINIVIPKAKNFAEMIYYYRLKCDFIRYKCQFLSKDALKEEIKHFEETYEKAEKIANQYLTTYHIRYLELMLTKCVFMYEVENKKNDPIEIAKKLIIPLKDKEGLDERTKQIVQIFRSNIIIWSGKCEADVAI